MLKILNSIKEYREADALSYSTLSKTARNPELLIKEDLIESPAMIFGQVIDTLITKPNEFENEFAILNFELPDKTTKLGQLVNTLWVMQSWDKDSIEAAYISTEMKQMKLDKAIQEFEPWKEKFEQLKQAEQSGKKVISDKTYNEASIVVNNLLTHQFSCGYFQNNNDVEIIYQIPMVFELNGRSYKDLPDLLYVNHKDKSVTSVDIKHTENLWDFQTSYLKYRYDLQECLHYYGAENYVSQILHGGYNVTPTVFLVCSKNSPGKILKFYTENYSASDTFYNGITTKYGKKLKSINQITEDYDFHIKSGIYDVSKDIYVNKGFMKIEI